MSTIPLPVSGGKNRIVCDGLTFWVYYDESPAYGDDANLSAVQDRYMVDENGEDVDIMCEVTA
jgi:hypothetical protein